MKPSVLLIIVTLFSINLCAQNSFDWPIKELDTAREVSYLTKEEKDVILELNKVRYNPGMYAQMNMKWMEVFYSGKMLKIPGKTVYKTSEGKEAFLECLEVLKKTKPTAILIPSRGMTKACDLLVYDQSSTGKTGHKGSGNSTPSDRVQKFGEFQGTLAENIHYGDCEPSFVIISLLIDDGVHSRGHRKNILSDEFNFVGVGIGSHKVYGEMCVNNYASKFIEKQKK